MKFLMTYASDPAAPPPTPEQMAAIGKFGHEKSQAGTLVMMGGIVRPSTGKKIALNGGEITVTDGPYAETKELIDGFAIIEVGSMEKAIEEASAFMKIAGEGRGEILRIYGPGEVPH
jgi:hypothetical protein